MQPPSKTRNGIAALVLGTLCLGAPTATLAVTVTPTLDGTTLVNALLGGGGAGIDLGSIGFTFSGHSMNGDMSAGTFTSATEYGIGDGIVISSGAVNLFGTSNSTAYGVDATAAQVALLEPISGPFAYGDVTQLDISFDMLPGFDTIFFNVTFQSVEFPVFVGSAFIDAFGLYVNGTNIAFVAGDPINIDHPFMGNDVANDNGVLGSALAGVGSDAVPPLFHTFSSPVNPTGNTITFIIADTGDFALDSYAFISQLGGTPPGEPTPIPEPSSLALLGLSLAGLGWMRRRVRR